MTDPRWNPSRQKIFKVISFYYSLLELQFDGVHIISDVFIADYAYQVRFAKLVCLNQIVCGVTSYGGYVACVKSC